MRTHVLLTALLLLACALPVTSQQPLVGCIKGTLKNQNGAPIPYAALTVTNIDSVESNSHRLTLVADKHGFFQFLNVPTGRYAVVVTKSGYRDYKVPLVTVYPGGTVNMPEIKMAPVAAH